MRWLLGLLGALLVLAVWIGVRWSADESVNSAAAPGVAPHDTAELTAAAESVRVAAGEAGGAAVAQTTADTPIALAGRVVEAQDCRQVDQAAPAVGVEVVLSRASLMGLGGEGGDLRVRTDEQGRFRFELDGERPRPARWNLVVAGTQELRAAVQVVVLEARQSVREDLLLVRCPLGNLAGEVVDLSGAPIEGVRVAFGYEGERREALSDAQGRYSLKGVSGGWVVEAELRGWSLVERDDARTDEAGNWNFVRVVLSPAADLALRVVDTAGRPLAGMRAGVRIAPVERLGPAGGRARPFWPEQPAGVTDESGAVLLRDVAAGQRLVLSVQGVPYDRQRDGLAVLASDEGAGRALVLRPGETFALGLQLTRGLRVHGRVTMPAGTAAVGARVRLCTREYSDGGDPAGFVDVQTAPDGSYEFDLSLPRVPSGLDLVAQAGADGSLPGQAFGPTHYPDPLFVATRRLPWPSDADALEIDLELQERPSISGHVFDAEGQPTSARLHLSQQDGPWDGRVLSSGLPRLDRCAKDGAFRFVGLEPGLYDLEVSGKGAARVDVLDIPAGSAGLAVHLGAPPAARVLVEVESPLELETVILLSGELRGPSAQSTELPELPAEVTLQEPFGWPAEALGLWYGSEGYRDEGGFVQFVSGPSQEGRREFSIDPGAWWFGAKAKAVGGVMCFPIGTGLVRVGPGEHRVRFVLEPSGVVEGRFLGLAPQADLHVALALPDGRLIPMDVRAARMLAVAELGADGSFRLPQVPARTLELRWGARAELLAGRMLGRRQVAVRAGATTTVEIEL